ncbi:hypothetical protein APR11_003610 [Nocardia amikacinitolerans]|nr:hypothetical protein [Nocardia amikacinitolerans]
MSYQPEPGLFVVFTTLPGRADPMIVIHPSGPRTTYTRCVYRLMRKWIGWVVPPMETVPSGVVEAWTSAV